MQIKCLYKNTHTFQFLEIETTLEENAVLPHCKSETHLTYQTQPAVRCLVRFPEGPSHIRKEWILGHVVLDAFESPWSCVQYTTSCEQKKKSSCQVVGKASHATGVHGTVGLSGRVYVYVPFSSDHVYHVHLDQLIHVCTVKVEIILGRAVLNDFLRSFLNCFSQKFGYPFC